MKRVSLYVVLLLLLGGWTGSLYAQTPLLEQPVPVMTLGTFHFAYPNQDAFQTAEEDQIDVLKEPWQSEIIAITSAIEAFKPTVIAVEWNPARQPAIDSLYAAYRDGRWSLGKNEIYQLGFRMAASLNLDKVYCVDDVGKPYASIMNILQDSLRMADFNSYYMQSPYLQYLRARFDGREKVHTLTEELLYYNDPVNISRSLSYYLLHPFKYEETPGDFTGVDFETGRWFNRNLRIFRNLQRIPVGSDDRILLIVGGEHLNLLNHFFEISAEYEFVSPVPYLKGL